MAISDVKQQPIPPYSIVRQGGTTSYLKGFRAHSTSTDEIAYRTYLNPVKTTTRLTTTDTSIQDGVEGNSQIDLFLFSHIFAGKDYDASIRTLFMRKEGAPYLFDGEAFTLSPLTNTFTNPALKHFAFVYGDRIHLIDSSGIVYRSQDSESFLLAEVATTLTTRLTELGLTNVEIKDVEVWQGRLWIVVDNFVVWCDTNNITEWRSEYEDRQGDTITTNAGFQDLPSSIVTLNSDGNSMYIFLENDAYSAQILDVGEQFGFTPLIRNFSAIAKGIATYAGLLVVSKSGVFIFQEGKANLISRDIDRRVGDFILGDNFSYTFIDSALFMRNDEIELIYDFAEGFLQVSDLGAGMYGSVDFGVLSIGELDSPIGSITQEIGQLQAKEGSIAVAIYPDLYMGFAGEFTENVIRFNYRRDGGGYRTNLFEITIPDLEEYRIRVKESEAIDWGDYLEPDRFGRVSVPLELRSPDIEITTPENKSVTSFIINERVVAF
ncbi:MAG: hypothetical protein ACR2N8_02980 [Parvibaculales bacterium]